MGDFMFAGRTWTREELDDALYQIVDAYGHELEAALGVFVDRVYPNASEQAKADTLKLYLRRAALRIAG